MPITGGAVRWQQQTDAVLNQAAPVQNTWYTVLNYTGRYTRVESVTIKVETTGETLETELEVDGIVYAGSLAATAGTNYSVYTRRHPDSAAGTVAFDTLSYLNPLTLEGDNIRVRVRKTTAAGAGNLRAKVIYALER